MALDLRVFTFQPHGACEDYWKRKSSKKPPKLKFLRFQGEKFQYSLISVREIHAKKIKGFQV